MQSGGGGTHIFDRTGMCRSNGSLFYKKSLNMGPIFYQKILIHGSTFMTDPKFSGFRMAKTPKIVKFLKNGNIFQEKILKNGYPFLPKSHVKMGRGFEARAAHPCPTQIWVPPRDAILYTATITLCALCMWSSCALVQLYTESGNVCIWKIFQYCSKFAVYLSHFCLPSLNFKK